MSNWDGKAGKGAMRALRTAKREEAQARQASFTAAVAQVRQDNPALTEAEARKVAATNRRAAREQ